MAESHQSAPSSQTHVAVVELNVYEDMFPIVCGYLQSMAQQDPVIAEHVRFTSHVACRNDPISDILADLVALAADVYAFSCYVWNMGVVKVLRSALAERFPSARFILGGPQVMNHADRYVASSAGEAFVCNGEGEVTFTELLRQMLSDAPDYSSVAGITYRDAKGDFVTTEVRPRITDLDSIPSPFLSNLFTDKYRMAVLETNRGCPYSCGFCYWGAANNSRIHRFDEQRIRDEIDWLSEHRIPIVHLADANFGILKRDLGLAHHMAACKDASRYPVAVIFSAAKNKPERVSEIAKRFAASGMVSTQPISLQSLDATTLEKIDRKNIKLGNFAEVQADLNANGLGSYIEMIWPLPGETLESFGQGIEDLCARDAGTIIVYAHMLLNNTPTYERREEFGLVTAQTDDHASEAEMVIATNEVTTDSYHDGLWFSFALAILFNCRTLQALPRYLHGSNVMGYRELFAGFAGELRRRVELEISAACHQAIEENRFHDISTYPTVYHLAMHEQRGELAAVFLSWAKRQVWWPDDHAQFLFELDMVTRPMLYSDTPLAYERFEFRHVEIVESSDLNRTYRVRVPAEFVELARLHMTNGTSLLETPHDWFMDIDHSKGQHPSSLSSSEGAKGDYRTGVVTRITTVLPTVTVQEAPSQVISLRGVGRQLVSLGRTIRSRP